jgi:hypothetical protein
MELDDLIHHGRKSSISAYLKDILAPTGLKPRPNAGPSNWNWGHLPHKEPHVRRLVFVLLEACRAQGIDLQRDVLDKATNVKDFLDEAKKIVWKFIIPEHKA